MHPYNDPKVIAGQGTVGLEMLQDKADLDCIVVPVGGGGLVAGTAIAADGLKRNVEIVGVEVENYAAAAQMLAGRPVAIRGGCATIAEGIAVRDVGALPISILRAHGVEVVAVSEQLIERALVLMLEIEKTVVEGAAAAALAAVLAQPSRFAGRKVGLILTGGNIDTRALANVLMRGFVSEGRLIHPSIEVPDKPGALAGPHTGCGGARRQHRRGAAPADFRHGVGERRRGGAAGRGGRRGAGRDHREGAGKPRGQGAAARA